MTAATLLDGLQARGVTVAARGDRLKLAAPLGILKPRVLDAIRRHKAELLAMLEPAPQSAPASELGPGAPPLAAFLAAVEARKVEHGLVSMTHDLLKKWRAAEEEAGHALTLSGAEPRRMEAARRDAERARPASAAAPDVAALLAQADATSDPARTFARLARRKRKAKR